MDKEHYRCGELYGKENYGDLIGARLGSNLGSNLHMNEINGY